MKKSEGSQHVYAMRTPCIKTDFGDRCMEELGNIRGLEIDEVTSYVLIPTRSKKDNSNKEETHSWTIYRLKCENEAMIETFDNLESKERPKQRCCPICKKDHRESHPQDICFNCALKDALGKEKLFYLRGKGYDILKYRYNPEMS